MKRLLSFLLFSFLIVSAQADISYVWKTKVDDFTQEREVLINAFVTAYGENTTQEQMAKACDEIIHKFKTLENDAHVLSVFENNQCVGVVFVDYDQLKSSAYIAQLAVIPNRWGKGVGKALLIKVVKHFNLASMTIAVRRTNKRAIAFYEKFGFIRIRSVPRGLSPFEYMGLKWERKNKYKLPMCCR